MSATTKTGNCGKCGGTGILRAFMHIDNGRCFACAGTGNAVAGRRAPALVADVRDWERECANYCRAITSNIRAGAYANGAEWLADFTGEDGWTMAGVERMLDGATPATAAFFRRLTGMAK